MYIYMYASYLKEKLIHVVISAKLMCEEIIFYYSFNMHLSYV